MSTGTNTTHSNNHDLAIGLAHSAATARLLESAGVTVLHASVGKRGMVMIVDRIPEGVPYGLKCRHPNGRGGRTEVLVANYGGVQLECFREVHAHAGASATVIAMVPRGTH